MNDKTFSVIIPVFNSGAYLERCLKSIINQTYKKFEIILIDDGSKDNSRSICEQYEKKYSFIKYYYKDNGGVSSARNMGIEKSNGEWIMFVDSDDMVNKNMLSILVQSMSNDIDIICYNYSKVKDDKHTEYRIFDDTKLFDSTKDMDEIYKLFILSKSSIFSVCTKIFKKSIIKKNNLCFNIQIEHAEDFEFTIKYMNCVTKQVLFLKEVFYNYIENSDSLTHKFNINQLDAHIDWLTILYKNIPFRLISTMYKDVYLTTFYEIKCFLINCIDTGNWNCRTKIHENEYISKIIRLIRISELNKLNDKILYLSMKWHCLFLFKLLVIIYRKAGK